MKIMVCILIACSVMMAEFVKKDDTVLDTKSKLVWQDNSAVESKEMLFSEANLYCKQLSLAGYNNWRLPTLRELQNIVDLKRHDPAISRTFEYTGRGNHWSSTPYVDDSIRGWAVDFKSGSTSHNRHSYDYYVRCVRGK